MQAAKTSHVRSVAAPLIMYGTAWKEDRTKALVLEAIAAGFRAFDTANQRKHYVEEKVGAAVRTAIASGTVAGSDLFLQTKFTHQRPGSPPPIRAELRSHDASAPVHRQLARAPQCNPHR